ncbi:MAG: cytochrome bc1 complex diheme cytochrome c subunit [Streptosporangiaceae bacterium]
MRPITARRRPAAGYAVILIALLVAGLGYATVTGIGAASAASHQVSGGPLIAEGRSIFSQQCASCHRVFEQGVPQTGPSLSGVGAAAVDFQVSTGRMPAKEPVAQQPRKPVDFSPQQIHALAAYIASLGGGPAIPSAAEVSPHGANSGLGQQLFVASCAQCHNFVGAGGALTFGKYAPPLTKSTPRQIFEAMLTGPEAMPVFNNTTITPQEKRDIISYITRTRTEPNPGGFSLGRVGPVTEGIVAFVGLMLFMVLASMWITAKHRKTHD